MPAQNAPRNIAARHIGMSQNTANQKERNAPISPAMTAIRQMQKIMSSIIGPHPFRFQYGLALLAGCGSMALLPTTAHSRNFMGVFNE